MDTLPSLEDCKQHTEKLKELKEIYKEVSNKLKEAHQSNARRYNLRRRHQDFQVNSLVWKKNFVQSNAANFVSAKLSPRFVGPYIVAKKVSPLICHLQDLNGKSIGNWHIADLKPYQC